MKKSPQMTLTTWLELLRIGMLCGLVTGAIIGFVTVAKVLPVPAANLGLVDLVLLILAAQAIEIACILISAVACAFLSLWIGPYFVRR